MRKSSGPDAHGMVPGRAVGHQLINHIAQRRLRVFIPLHDNVAVRPPLLPCGLILGQRTCKVPAWLHVQLEQGIHVAAGSQPDGKFQGDGTMGSVTGTAHSHAVTGIRDKSGCRKALCAAGDRLNQRQLCVLCLIAGGEPGIGLLAGADAGHLDDLGILLHLIIRDGAVAALVVNSRQKLYRSAAPEFKPLKQEARPGQ